jgi:hypothetical protein
MNNLNIDFNLLSKFWMKNHIKKIHLFCFYYSFIIFQKSSKYLLLFINNFKRQLFNSFFINYSILWYLILNFQIILKSY